MYYDDINKNLTKFEETIKNITNKKIILYSNSIQNTLSVITFIQFFLNHNYNVVFISKNKICHEIINSKFKNIVNTFYIEKKILKNIKKIINISKPNVFLFLEDKIVSIFITFLLKKNQSIKICLLNTYIKEKKYKLLKYFSPVSKKIYNNYNFIFPINKDEESKYKNLIPQHKNIKYVGNLNIENEIEKNNIIINEFKQYKETKDRQQNTTNNDNIIAKCELIKQTFKDKKIILFSNIHQEEFFYVIWQYSMLLKSGNYIGIFLTRNIKYLNDFEEILNKNEINNIKFDDFCGNNETNTILLEHNNLLRYIYYICDISVVCGSFVNQLGGHSPLSSVCFNKITLIGNYYRISKNIIDDLVKNNIVIKTQNLCSNIMDILLNKQKQDNILSKQKDFINQNKSTLENIYNCLINE